MKNVVLTILPCILLMGVCNISVVSAQSVSNQSASVKPPPQLARPAKVVEWTDLLPEDDLRLLESIPVVDHATLSEEELAQDAAPATLKPVETLETEAGRSAFEDQIAGAIGQANQQVKQKQNNQQNSIEQNADQKETRDWRDALKSTRVRSEFNNQKIKIAGYIVPIEYDEQNTITEFFLVPYYGACIHVPPPPPNQIIYVKYPKGFQLQELYLPFWVDGTVVLETQENELGLSSYSMRDVTLTAYEEEDVEYLN